MRMLTAALALATRYGVTVSLMATAMNARVSCEFVGAREAFFASGERAQERLLSGVRPYVAGLACDL